MRGATHSYRILQNCKNKMNLLKNRNKVFKKINNKHKILLLDYDGTLTEIVSKPNLAILSNKRRKLLQTLSKKSDITLAVVSGRALKDVKKLVNIAKIYYSGNHGFEIKGPGLNKINSAAKKFMKKNKPLKSKFRAGLKSINGVIIEDKGLTLSVHYRLVKEKDLNLFKRTFKKIIFPYLKKKSIRLTFGKKVFEIRPPVNWNKGKAVKFLLKYINRKKTVPIYAGDDTTDEDAFKAIRKNGITIAVGRKKTKANYFIKNVNGFYKFLELLIKG